MKKNKMNEEQGARSNKIKIEIIKKTVEEVR